MLDVSALSLSGRLLYDLKLRLVESLRRARDIIRRFSRLLSMSKRQRTESLFAPFKVVSECPPPAAGTRLIGTHDGTFHCDEALGCAMLQLMPAWAGSTIVCGARDANLQPPATPQAAAAPP